MAYTYAGEWTEGIFSAAGVAQVALPVTLYLPDGATKASLYTDASKGTAQANPKNTDGNGNISLFADPGAYIVSYTPTGGSTVTVPITIPLNPSEIGSSGALDANARVNVMLDGTSKGKRRAVNLKTGSNVTLTVADDSTNEKVDVTIAASAGAGTPSGFDASIPLSVGPSAGNESAWYGIPRNGTLDKVRFRSSPGNGPTGATGPIVTITRYWNGLVVSASNPPPSPADSATPTFTIQLPVSAASTKLWDTTTTGGTNTEHTKAFSVAVAAGERWLIAITTPGATTSGSDLAIDLHAS